MKGMQAEIFYASNTAHILSSLIEACRDSDISSATGRIRFFILGCEVISV